MNAATNQPEGQNDAGANPFAALFNQGQQGARQAPAAAAADGGPGPNAAPLPNPWGPPCRSQSRFLTNMSIHILVCVRKILQLQRSAAAELSEASIGLN